ncbi:MAG TPA: DUF1684 domain-containing protein [Pyrinomonadaceae bacterium]|nr:DUF1684 domain-containing protein [Pyrinomonadaceae bacterium]
MKQIVVLISISLFLFLSSCSSNSAYRSEIEKWRVDHEAELKKDDGWLTVAGLFWLKDGTNTIGKGDKYEISLTDSFKQDNFGKIDFHNGKAILAVEPGAEAIVDDKPVSTVELISDDPGPATKVQTGSETFHMIKREDRYGIRLKDSQAPQRINLTGEHWYPVDEKYRVTGTFEPFDTEQEVEIPNVLGGTFKMKSPGVVKFKLDGRDFSLQPVVENDKELFFIFKDLTAKDETYQAGRFLYTDRPVNGQVVLDFNKAENPPCAFTQFATCPLPPPQNRLDVEIRAGELKTH